MPQCICQLGHGQLGIDLFGILCQGLKPFHIFKGKYHEQIFRLKGFGSCKSYLYGTPKEFNVKLENADAWYWHI